MANTALPCKSKACTCFKVQQPKCFLAMYLQLVTGNRLDLNEIYMINQRRQENLHYVQAIALLESLYEL